MRTILLLAALAAAACGKSGDGDHWTKHPIKTVEGTIKGIAYTIDLPDGMRAKPSADEVEYDFLVGEYVKTPNFTISAGGYAKTLDDYIKTEPKVDKWLRKDTLPDGYVVSYENTAYKGKEDYIVYAYHAAGDKVLTCQGRVTPWDRGEKVADKVPLVEKACVSLKAK